MRFLELNTIKEYNEANANCHNILKDVNGYNSQRYASIKPIESINNTYLLPLIDKFEEHLPYNFVEVLNNYIKVIVL